MKTGRPPIEMLVFGVLILTVAGIAGAFLLSSKNGGNSMLPVMGQVPEFMLTNQEGRAVSGLDLKGQIWLGNIIFTRCGGPCPKLSRQMQLLGERFSDRPSVRLVSLTADPVFDTPEVLRRYGETFGAEVERWHFLTGRKEDVLRLAVDGLKLTMIEKGEGERENPNDLFIHSSYVTLVDGRGRLRAVTEALEPDAADKIIRAVELLLKEDGY